MAKMISCKEAGGDCNWVARGADCHWVGRANTTEELLEKIKEHAIMDHRLPEPSQATLEKTKPLMVDE